MPPVLIVSNIANQCFPRGSPNLQLWLKDNKPISSSKKINKYSSIIPARNRCVIPLSESHITSNQKGIMEDNLTMCLFNIWQFTQVTSNQITPPIPLLTCSSLCANLLHRGQNSWLKRSDHKVGSKYVVEAANSTICEEEHHLMLFGFFLPCDVGWESHRWGENNDSTQEGMGMSVVCVLQVNVGQGNFQETQLVSRWKYWRLKYAWCSSLQAQVSNKGRLETRFELDLLGDPTWQT